MVEEALSVIEQLEKVYFEQRDLSRVLDCLDNDIMWFGTGPHEVCVGKKQAEEILAAEAENYHGFFHILHSDYQTMPISESACIVVGTITMQERGSSESASIVPLFLRLSTVFRKTDQGIKLYMLHLSAPNTEQQDDEFFPKALKKDKELILKQLLDKKSAELEESNQDLKALTNNIPGSVQHCLNDEYFTILRASDGFLDMFGYTKKDLKGLYQNRFINLICAEDRTQVAKNIAEQLKKGNTIRLEYRVCCKDGQYKWVLDNRKLLSDKKGRETFYCILVDITKQKQDSEQLQLSLDRHKIILGQTNDIIFEWDPQKDSILFSDNWNEKFGYKPITENISASFGGVTHIHLQDAGRLIALVSSIYQGKPYAEEEFRIRNEHDIYKWYKIRVTTMFDREKRPIKAVGVMIDIDSEKRKSKELTEQAQRDQLTELYNKATSGQLIRDYLKTSQNQHCHALMILDIDDFKTINDTQGHLFGDAVLSDVAKCLRSQFRKTDIVGRLGGDEFIVLFKDAESFDTVGKKASDILHSIQCLSSGETSLSLSGSIGIAFIPLHGTDFNKLYQKADIALYQAKSKGKRQYAFYSDSMEQLPSFSHGAPCRCETGSKPEIAQANNHLMRELFHLLYTSSDTENTIRLILEKCGQYFQVSRAYTFEVSLDNHHISNTFEWCAEAIAPQKDLLQDIPLLSEPFLSFLNQFNEKGILYCKDLDCLSQREQDFFRKRGVRSMLHCGFYDHGIWKGFVGIEDCVSSRYWTLEQTATLTSVAEILGTFLVKRTLEGHLFQSGPRPECNG